MRISFVWDWPSYDPQTFTWQDGLAAAIKILSERHEVQILTCSMNGKDYTLYHPYFPIQISTDITRDVAAFKPDVVLMWGDCTRPNAHPVSELNIPMALCFAGGQVDGPTHGHFDHFFVESQSYKERFEVLGCSVSTAFGTNTELFKPIPKQPKVLDVIFPATYARWKRHDLYAEAVNGLKAAAVGYMINNGWDEASYHIIQDNQILCLPHVSADAVKYFLAASKCCCITSYWTGGSQRTVLEAMAMNVPLVVMSDSDKTSEYVREAGQGLVVDPEPKKIRAAVEQMMTTTVNTRDYILSKWSETHYADALEAGLQQICSPTLPKTL